MVFDKLYPPEFLLKRPSFSFLLGIGYTIIGIFLAIMIFPESPALIAIGIASLLFVPSLYNLTSSAELTQKKQVSFWNVLKANFPMIKIYVFLFFGIFFTFVFFSIALPKLASYHLFEQQLAVLAGGATFTSGLFWHLFTWNLQVLFLCFIISLVAGNGAILFIAWNASVWGTVFGNLAKTAAVTLGGSSVIILILILISVFPHMFLEGLSYIIGTVSGTILSDGICKEKFFSKEMGKIIKYNALLLLLAIGVLLIACIVETFVLDNFETYRMISRIAFGW